MTCAFSFIVRHLNSPASSKEFKERFPFFKKYKRFICVDASKEDFEDKSRLELEILAFYLYLKGYLVIVDDAHLLLKSDKGRYFRDLVSLLSDWLILLSSLPFARRKIICQSILFEQTTSLSQCGAD